MDWDLPELVQPVEEDGETQVMKELNKWVFWGGYCHLKVRFTNVSIERIVARGLCELIEMSCDGWFVL